MSSLTFENVGKTYPDGTVAVSNVSFAVEDGEFVVMVGPSGCGKSTLLRIAAGLEELTHGRALQGEDDVSHTAPEDRDVAMVFQNYALYPHMTVRQNMAFALEQRKRSREDIGRQIAEVATMLDLSPYLDRKPGQLSGGQRQRVAMGRAIVRHPRAFLMDEPLSNLDAKLRVQMRGELKVLNERLKVTTLYVTHDQVEAMTMGDRVAVLKPVADSSQSNLQQIGTPQELYDRPANLFVAGFIGSPAMNFLHAHVEVADGKLGARIEGTDIVLFADRNRALSGYDGRTVIAGVRPEAFMAVEAGQGLIDAVVIVTEALGADTFVFFELPSPQVHPDSLEEERVSFQPGDVSRLVARIRPEQAVPKGETLRLGVDPDKLHWFDPATGLAIR